jgi:hypothetical protein
MLNGEMKRLLQISLETGWIQGFRLLLGFNADTNSLDTNRAALLPYPCPKQYCRRYGILDKLRRPV